MKRASGDKAAARRARAIAPKLTRVRDRRRFRQALVPTGEIVRTAPADASGTKFPSRVADPTDGAAVLKDGASNSKIGGDVLVGRLRGARIFTLTLEERATCPASCPLWRGCYGNSMQWTVRWRHGAALETAIADEVALLIAAHGTILVRLHVLGDFYSTGYVGAWWRLLERWPGLNVFGFTAWGPETEIGGMIAIMRERFGLRAAIRHSGRCMPWGSFTVDFPTERKQIGDALVCPEQRDAMEGSPAGRHCGSCAACWSTDRPIVFVEH